jgi:hypothetical protein
MTRRALLATIASVAGVRLPLPPDPERIDDENPEITEEELRRMRPAAEVLPELIGQDATDELMRQSRERREWNDLLARGQARLRAMLKAEGRDLDRMSEDEVTDYVTDYVDRIIHEHRAEERAKLQAAS